MATCASSSNVFELGAGLPTTSSGAARIDRTDWLMWQGAARMSLAYVLRKRVRNIALALIEFERLAQQGRCRDEIERPREEVEGGRHVASIERSPAGPREQRARLLP